MKKLFDLLPHLMIILGIFQLERTCVDCDLARRINASLCIRVACHIDVYVTAVDRYCTAVERIESFAG